MCGSLGSCFVSRVVYFQAVLCSTLFSHAALPPAQPTAAACLINQRRWCSVWLRSHVVLLVLCAVCCAADGLSFEAKDITPVDAPADADTPGAGA